MAEIFWFGSETQPSATLPIGNSIMALPVLWPRQVQRFLSHAPCALPLCAC
jgi:hypothetical protein